MNGHFYFLIICVHADMYERVCACMRVCVCIHVHMNVVVSQSKSGR